MDRIAMYLDAYFNCIEYGRYDMGKRYLKACIKGGM